MSQSLVLIMTNVSASLSEIQLSTGLVQQDEELHTEINMETKRAVIAIAELLMFLSIGSGKPESSVTLSDRYRHK
jgi:hypothetical protein